LLHGGYPTIPTIPEVQVTIVGKAAEGADTYRARPAVAPRLAIPAVDWEALIATRVNTVIVGHEDAARGVWTAVWPTLQKPIYWVEADRLSLPRQSTGTLILQGAHALSASAQLQVFEWLDRDARATRVLTATPHALYPLVERGTFLESLYYRLNMLLLIL
jgi:hypothetical protein